MYKICRSDESLARQRALETALMHAMREKRFENISVNSLCDQTGVSRNAFYRYFPSKEDALLALIDHTLMASSETSVFNWKGGVHLEIEDVETFFLFWQEKQDFLDALTANKRTWLLLERCSVLYDEMNPLTEDDNELISFAQEQARYIFVIGMMSAMLRWYQHGFPVSPKEMAMIAYDLFSIRSVEMRGLFL